MLLSICIPTFNQPDRLVLLLRSLETQYSSDVEILICDDSTDLATSNALSEFKDLNIRYTHRRGSKGVDSALLDLLKTAKGDYIWWFGDDILLPGALERIKSFIKETPDLSFIWLNSEDETDKNSRTFGFTESRIFRNKDELLQHDIGLLGFISAVIIKRSLTKKALLQAEKYIGSSFLSLYITLNVISEGDTLGIIGDSCFTSLPKPAGEVRWYNQTEVFGINLYLICRENGQAFSKKALDSALSRNMSRVLKAIIVERSLGHNTGFANQEFQTSRLIKLYWRSPKFWILYSALFIPRIILKSLYKATTSIRRKIQ